MGGAVGDALGLPYEGMSPRRLRRLATFPLRHKLLPGYGMISDDTDHAIFVSQALIKSQGNLKKFKAALAWRLRFWLLCLPAGVGFATLRSIGKLWLGFSSSGVYSAGNGPCMRSAMIGALLANDASSRRVFVHTSTTMTHTDPKALAGAMAIAEVAARIVSGEWTSRPSLEELIKLLSSLSQEEEWQLAVKRISEDCRESNPILAAQPWLIAEKGVSGYVLHTVPFALIAWYQHHGNYRATIEEVIRAGGDTDTVAAIAGALAGATTGLSGIPEEWREGLLDWPHSKKYIAALGMRCSDNEQAVSLGFSFFLFPRNILFLIIVLLHGFRRLLPPY